MIYRVYHIHVNPIFYYLSEKRRLRLWGELGGGPQHCRGMTQVTGRFMLLWRERGDGL